MFLEWAWPCGCDCFCADSEVRIKQDRSKTCFKTEVKNGLPAPTLPDIKINGDRGEPKKIRLGYKS